VQDCGHAYGIVPSMLNSVGKAIVCLGFSLLAGCGDGVWNSPNSPGREGESTYYSVIYAAPPKHLDPALSYSTDESLFIDQIYQQPLGYHFLKRPYELVPLALTSMPTFEHFDRKWNPVPRGSDKISYTRYTLTLRDDLYYQPHPAFVLDEKGQSKYLFDTADESSDYSTVPDFPETGSRKVKPEDFMYGIKRLADPKNKSPMLSFMGQYIVGFRELTYRLQDMKERPYWLNLEEEPMKGMEVLDDHRFTITIHDEYPQFLYWLAMHFFAPVPMEADRFYHNPGFREKNLTLDWWPVGTGAYMMAKNDPNNEIVLEKNPNYQLRYYPEEGAPGDLEAGHLEDAGKRIPFIDRAHFSLEKEVLPLWTKFLQGYYDRSGEVHANTRGFFDQAFVSGGSGLELSQEMLDHKLSISQDVKPSLYYYGFNMRDPVVGGYTEQRRKLRRALSIAWDMEEFGSIFYNGLIIAAQSPVPPGIPGALEGEAGMNSYMYDWVDGKPQRKSIEYARQLMVEAGYPNGRDVETGEPLRLYIDVQSQGIDNAQMNWIVRQYQKLGVQIEFRPADWNRTREKLLTGNTQIYSHGWLADYPDPENFLFLMYGPEGPLTCHCDGANNSNYENKEFDDLFKRMRVLEAGAEREAIVAQMVELWRRDAVWMHAFHPLEFYLNNEWVHNTKRHGISKRTLEYVRIDDQLRAKRQVEWNQPVVWPLVVGVSAVVALILPGFVAYRRRQRATIRK
jgi:oligopeptide transport system substrate-binding protein